MTPPLAGTKGPADRCSQHVEFVIPRYGEEVARLMQANVVVKKGYDIARRSGVASAVVQDIKVDRCHSFVRICGRGLRLCLIVVAGHCQPNPCHGGT